MRSRGRVVLLAALCAGTLVIVGMFSGAGFQSSGNSALDVQVVGALNYQFACLWIAVSDAAGPVTDLARGNVYVEALMYPFRDVEKPPEESHPKSLKRVDFHNRGDGVYEMELVPNAGKDNWDESFEYVIKVHVESPAGTGSALCTFKWVL